MINYLYTLKSVAIEILHIQNQMVSDFQYDELNNLMKHGIEINIFEFYRLWDWDPCHGFISKTLIWYYLQYVGPCIITVCKITILRKPNLENIIWMNDYARMPVGSSFKKKYILPAILVVKYFDIVQNYNFILQKWVKNCITYNLKLIRHNWNHLQMVVYYMLFKNDSSQLKSHSYANMNISTS